MPCGLVRLSGFSNGFLNGFSNGFLVAKQLLKERSHDNDPHIKLVELFMPETMAVSI